MKDVLGYCGINCSKCPTNIATKNNDDVLRMKTSIEWSRLFNKTIVPSKINCNGCKSENDLFENCHTCEIRKSGIQKKIIRDSA